MYITKNMSQDITLGEALQEYLNEKRAQGLAEISLFNYDYTLKRDLDLNRWASSVSQRYWYEIINTLRSTGVKDTTVNGHMRFVKAFFIWCADDERQYMRPFKMPLVRVSEEQFKLFTDEDLAKLLVKPTRVSTFAEWRNYTIVNFVLATGCRCATLVNIHIGDINFERREIVLYHTKNRKAQTIPLSTALNNILADYMRMWRHNVSTDNMLFPSVSNGQLTTGGLQHSFAAYCRQRGCARTNIHGLRHNFAKGWIRNNGNAFALQNVLGHSTLDMTKRYVRLFDEDIKNDYDKFSPLDSLRRSSTRANLVGGER